MKKRYCIIFCILFFQVFFACKTDIKQEPVKKDGMVYGITKGAFRHNWWNYYERGVSFADGRLWPQAEADFREAVSLWDVDERRARTYGMHFIDYFPHRELGTALFYQARFEEAAQELEKSLSFVKTAKAELYLDRARKSYIEQKGLDKKSPEITIEYPGKNAVLNDFKIFVKGRASDDTFVKEVLVNNKAFRIDLSGQVIDFKQEISLSPGKNDILLEARDLTGKITKITHTIMCDRAGPILNIDDILHSSGSEYILKGYAYDDSQIRNITVNKKIISENPGSEVLIDYSFQLASNEKIEITALDAAGNQTRALIPRPQNQPETSSYKNKETYYASLVSDALYYAGSDMDKNQADQRGIPLVPSPVKSRYCESLGEYYALITGINEYEQWPVLKTAVNDAMGMKDVLVRRYGFKEENVVLRINEQADWNTMLNDLRHMAGRLTECDNLLIYFAGHGKVDSLTKGGSWIPVNGSLNNATTWVSNSAITEIFSSEGVKGKNIVIIADSCYSGTLLREGSTTVSDTEEDYQTRLLELGSKKSRQIITSGGNEPVADSGMDNHSIFAYYLLRALEENQRPIIDIENLMMSYVWKYVTEKGGQRPNIGRLKTPMDDYGQYVLALGGRLPEGVEIPRFSRMRRTKETPVSSNYSDYIDKNPPKIEVKKWVPKKTVFQDKAYLEGKAEDETGIQHIMINGNNILKRPGKEVYFNHLTDLKDGDNVFKVECLDQVGNKAEDELEIKRIIPKIYDDDSRMAALILPFAKDEHYDKQVEEMFQKQMAESKRFNIKKVFAPLTQEQLADPGRLKSVLKELGAGFIISGSIVKKEKALDIYAEITEIENSSVLTKQNVYGESELSKELIETLCQGLAVKLGSDLPIAQGEIKLVKGDKIILTLGEQDMVKTGMHLIFYQMEDPIIDDTGEVIVDAYFEELGTARLEKVLKNASFAQPFNKDVFPKLKQGTQVVMK